MTLPATPTAAGCISGLKHNTATALSDITAFQQFMGVSTAADALTRIYGAQLPGKRNALGEIDLDELIRLRPFAQLYVLQYSIFSVGARSSTQAVQPRSAIHIHLERGLGEHRDDYSAAEQDFENYVGQIMSGLGAYRAAGYPLFDEISLAEPAQMPSRDEKYDIGECFACVILATRSQQ